MKRIKGLGVFSETIILPQGEVDQAVVLQSDLVRRVICCALGPEGTNTAQAARAWLMRMDIEEKSAVKLLDTPEACLGAARNIVDDGTLAIFWTHAVYDWDNPFFFGNPDVYPFVFQVTTPLDGMQLATTRKSASMLLDSSVPGDWRIASHASSRHLLRELDNMVVLVSSDAAAAAFCSRDSVHACITTESARGIYDLQTIHLFGSPQVVSFGGITAFGARILVKAAKSLQVIAEHAYVGHSNAREYEVPLQAR